MSDAPEYYDEEWKMARPAVPLPLYGSWLWLKWHSCGVCSRKFAAEDRYEDHWIDEHYAVEGADDE